VPAPAALAGPTVALDLTTGKRNWYFQGAPADPYDYDVLSEERTSCSRTRGVESSSCIRT